MQKTVYENYKYSLQDTAKVYIGAKYTFAELLEQDDVAFKFRLIVERYILAEKEVDPEDTLETHLYYLKPDSFLVKIYDRIKARVKINIIEEKKGIFGSSSVILVGVVPIMEYLLFTISPAIPCTNTPHTAAEKGFIF